MTAPVSNPEPNICRRRLTTALVTSLLLAGCTVAQSAPPRTIGSEAGSRAHIQAMVVREALDVGIPASLALAVAHAESNFDPVAESSKGARGVMQVMPATARGEYGIHPDRLWEPRINIRLGLHFLRRLIDRYDGHTDLALSHYNGGSAVSHGPRPRVISATRRYVAKVRRLQAVYHRRILEGSV